MQKILAFCLFLFTVTTQAQKFTISGTLKDAANGEDLVGAVVLVKELPGTGASANVYGFFSLSLEKGSYTLLFQYSGYETISKTVNLSENLKLDLQLISISKSISEVVIQAEKEDQNLSKTEMSVTRLDPKSIETVPVLLGEKDIMKTLQLTPGVKTAGEGNSGFFVRGGTADQNLILLDEAPVYNASHLLGFFSVFNSDALKDVTLYKGGIPAQYGGRGSSVVDVTMRDGNNKKFGASGGIGLITSRLTVEGPIVKEKGSFIVSGRRSYADLFLKLSSNESIKNSGLYFYDLNLKANYKITDKDRVFISGYFGRDNFNFGKQFGFGWGNATGTVRWNHLFSERLFSNTSLVYSNFDYAFNIGSGEEKFGIKSSIRDYNLKQDFSFYKNTNNTLKFGFNIIHHTFRPGEITGSNESFNKIKLANKYAAESGVYVQNEQKISELFSLQYGFRYSCFNYLGKGTAYTYDASGAVIGEAAYQNGQTIKQYGGFEPRIAANYRLDELSSVKASYNRNYQYMHLLSNSTTSAPTDLWVPSSNNVKPQIVDQVALGYFRNLQNNMFETSVEVYYKVLQNQIDYRPGAQLVLNNAVEGQLVYGKGMAYGAEFYIKKNKGNLTGWLSYTLSRSLRKFESIDNGKIFPARQDRIHDVAVVAMYKLSEKLALSANWIFYTGSAATFPSGKYEVLGQSIPRYTERNGYRMPNYHRLDMGLTWYRKKTEKYESNWNFSVYNLYARENAYSITFRQNENNPNQTEAVRVALFKIVPAITYNFKF